MSRHQASASTRVEEANEGRFARTVVELPPGGMEVHQEARLLCSAAAWAIQVYRHPGGPVVPIPELMPLAMVEQCPDPTWRDPNRPAPTTPWVYSGDDGPSTSSSAASSTTISFMTASSNSTSATASQALAPLASFLDYNQFGGQEDDFAVIEDGDGLAAHSGPQPGEYALLMQPVDSRPAPFHRRLGFAVYDRFLSHIVGDDGLVDGAGPGSWLSQIMQTAKSYLDAAPILKGWPNLGLGLGAETCTQCFGHFDVPAATKLLGCGHRYCNSCLQEMALRAAKDAAFMPPRCCGRPVPPVVLDHLLPDRARAAFLDKVIECSIPPASRLTCPNQQCGRFISPTGRSHADATNVRVCAGCGWRVCVGCKGRAHIPGQVCPDERGYQDVLKLGREAGWQRCYQCRAMVERDDGCSHMLCICSAQFCYHCGAAWTVTVGCPNDCDARLWLERCRPYKAEKKRRRRLGVTSRPFLKKDAGQWGDRGVPAGTLREQALRTSQAADLERLRGFVRDAHKAMLYRHEIQSSNSRANFGLMKQLHCSQAASLMRHGHRHPVDDLDDLALYHDQVGTITRRQLLGLLFRPRTHGTPAIQALHHSQKDKLLSDWDKAKQHLVERFRFEEQYLHDWLRLRIRRMKGRWMIEAEIVKRILQYKTGQKYERQAPPECDENSLLVFSP